MHIVDSNKNQHISGLDDQHKDVLWDTELPPHTFQLYYQHSIHQDKIGYTFYRVYGRSKFPDRH